MGQQQLLLIVLGVIIVGLAIVIGISLFNSNAESSNRDAIIGNLSNLGSLARKYYFTSRSLAGGNQSFTGWTIPDFLASNGDGSFSATVSDQQIIISGIGVQSGNDGSAPVKAIDYVSSARDSIVIVN